MKKRDDYRIYSKEDKSQNRLSFIYHLFWLSGVLLLFFYLYNFGNFSFDLSSEHELWVETYSIFSVIMSFIGGGALIITFREGQKATRKANTLPVCIEIFQELRSEKFLEDEKIIFTRLSENRNFDTIDKEIDEELDKTIRSYLHVMNNISALVIHNIVDDDPIIAYKGVDILYYYEMLEPYIKRSRNNLGNKMSSSSFLSVETKSILERSSHLNYAHYELFVKQIKEKSSYLISEFNDKLNCNQKDNSLACRNSNTISGVSVVSARNMTQTNSPNKKKGRRHFKSNK